MGCGTGSHSHLLNIKGFKCLGFDLNPTMVDYARSHYKENEFILGDMREVNSSSLGKRFDMVTCMTTTFPYNISNGEASVALSNFYDLLNPGGVLIIDNFNPIVFLQAYEFKGSFFPEDEKDYRQLGLKLSVEHSISERDQTLIERKRIYDLNDSLLADDVTHYRLFFPQEFSYFLSQAGFSNILMNSNLNINDTSLKHIEFTTIAYKK